MKRDIHWWLCDEINIFLLVRVSSNRGSSAWMERVACMGKRKRLLQKAVIDEPKGWTVKIVGGRKNNPKKAQTQAFTYFSTFWPCFFDQVFWPCYQEGVAISCLDIFKLAISGLEIEPVIRALILSSISLQIWVPSVHKILVTEVHSTPLFRFHVWWQHQYLSPIADVQMPWTL